MSLIKDLKKLAGVKQTNEEKIVEKQEEDFSPEEMRVVRAALVKTIKSLEKESRDTNSPSLTKMYKQDADVYDSMLDMALKGKREAAARLWSGQDTGCRDHIFDLVSDVQDRQIIAKFLNTTLLKEDVRRPTDEEYKKAKAAVHGEEIHGIGVEEETGIILIGTTEGEYKLHPNGKLEVSEGLKKSGVQLNEEAYSDVKFYVVLTPTKNSEFGDVLGEVSMQGLKNLVLGTPRGEIKDLLIFPASMKQKAHDVAMDRWHDAKEAPEDEEKTITEDVEEKFTNKQEWLDAINDYDPKKKAKIEQSGPKSAPASKLTAYCPRTGRMLGWWEDGKEGKGRGVMVVKLEEAVAHLDFRVHLKFDNEWKRWEAFASEGKAHTEGKKMVADSSATDYKVVKESEQLDEISKKTLLSYAKKAVDDVSYNSFIAGDESARSSVVKDRSFARSMEADKKAMKRQRGVEKAIDRLAKESEETKVVPLDVEQGDLEKQAEMKPEVEKVPAEVFEDINKMIKEIKFKVDHLSHIDPTYQEHGYWFQFMVLLQQIADMLKQGTDEAFKEAAVKLQSFENVALVQVPDSLWKFLSVDMYKPAEKRKGPSLSAKFQEVKRGEQ